MSTKAVQQDVLSTKLRGRWEQVGQKLLALAEEVPASKFDYRPVKEARSFAEVFRHVAFWNRYVAEVARGQKSDDSGNEISKEQYATKRQILEALKHSFTDATDVLKNSPNLSADTAEMLVTFIEHNCEHYGQLVVYVRLNGIIPPASRA